MMPLLLLSTSVIVLITTWSGHPICSEAQLWDDMRDYQPTFSTKGQLSPNPNSLPMVIRDGTASAAGRIVTVNGNKTPSISPDTVIDRKKSLIENRKRRKGKRGKRKPTRSHSRKHDSRNRMESTSQQKDELLGLGRHICSMVSESNLITEAVNNYGQIVQIAPVKGHDGTEKGNSFHETYCESERESCDGIDRSEYQSYCQTEYRYVYAPTVSDEKIGLSLIKIRAGCNCIIQKKMVYMNIMGKIG